VLTERFAEEVLARLGSGPRTPYSIAVELLDAAADTDTCQAALSTVVCVLEHFERVGALSAETDASGVRWFALASQAGGGA
jgi:hypothetical protein